MSRDIDLLLKEVVDKNASDLHIKVGRPPTVRIDGTLITMEGEQPFSDEDMNNILSSVLNETQRVKLEKDRQIDTAYGIHGLSRFRCNCYYQRGSVGINFRIINSEIPGIEELLLPTIIEKISLEPRGLILVTGTTGSGKSTTLASMIDYINSNKTVNIITIEDPIEYLHRDNQSIISQREIGSDATSFSKALRASLRQDPDVILVGEMRDFETIKTALDAAETGHLVLSTLHTIDTVETVNRIISVFPPYQHKQVRAQLGSVLKAIISMRLLPMADGNGRVPAVEILRNTATIRGCIEDPEKTKSIPEFIAEGFSQYGMQTFDQSLLGLYNQEMITYDEAINIATNPDDFALKVKGVQSTKDLWSADQAIIKEETDDEGPDIERFSS